MKKLLLPSIVAISFGIGCGSAGDVNSANSNANTNGNVMVNLDANSLPPEFSTKPLAPSANSTPGIPPPGQANITPKGPIPGIPEPGDAGKPLKRGATPTPGIPSEEEIRRQMRHPVGNVNSPPPNAGTTPSIRKKPRPVGNNN